MQSINPFTNEDDFAEGGIYSCHANDIATNFPACKSLWHWDDVADGEITWEDRVTGAVMHQSNTQAPFNKNSNGVYPTAQPTVTGTMMSLGQSDIVAMIVGYFAAQNNKFIWGDPDAGPAIELRPNTNYIERIDATNYKQTNTMTGVIAAYDISACLSTHIDCTADTAEKYMITDDGTDSAEITTYATQLGTLGGTDWGQFANYVDMATSSTWGAKVLAVFEFENGCDDTEYKLATAWMAANPGKLYPGWAGKS